MGSQSVTNFSSVRKKRIQHGILAFQPESPEANTQAQKAAVAALGVFAPTSPFVQALTSASVDTAAKILGSFVKDMKAASTRKSEELLAKYGVGPSESKPYAPVVATLRRNLEEALSAASNRTETASSASDAIGTTLLDVLRRSFPDRREPTDASGAELVQAIRRTPVDRFSGIFLRNLISSLLRRAFDTARDPKISRSRIDDLIARVGPTLANDLASELTRVDADPGRIRKLLSRIEER